MADPWGTPIEVERRRRILLSLWAFAYERGDQLIDDVVYDREAYLVDLSIDTGHPVLDKWFRENYLAYTGQWVAGHPERDKLQAYYERVSLRRNGKVLPGPTRGGKRASLRGVPQGSIQEVRQAG